MKNESQLIRTNLDVSTINETLLLLTNSLILNNLVLLKKCSEFIPSVKLISFCRVSMNNYLTLQEHNSVRSTCNYFISSEMNPKQIQFKL